MISSVLAAPAGLLQALHRTARAARQPHLTAQMTQQHFHRRGRKRSMIVSQKGNR